MCKCQICITTGCDILGNACIRWIKQLTCYRTYYTCNKCISNAVTWTWPFLDRSSTTYHTRRGKKLHHLHCSPKANNLTLPWCIVLRHFCQSIFQQQMWMVRRDLFFPFALHKLLRIFTFFAFCFSRMRVPQYYIKYIDYISVQICASHISHITKHFWAARRVVVAIAK